MADAQALGRGRDAVKAALIEAACEMLAEVGPNAMSVRNVATRAGVNHGQVYHYFGNKQGLIEAAVHKLASEHFQHAHERSGGAPVPKALTLGEDSSYLLALLRLILDGHLATATKEIDEGISIPIEFRQHVTRDFPADGVPIEIKARLALLYAVELGWSALEPYILTLADVRETEVEAVREAMRAIASKQLADLAQRADNQIATRNRAQSEQKLPNQKQGKR